MYGWLRKLNSNVIYEMIYSIQKIENTYPVTCIFTIYYTSCISQITVVYIVGLPHCVMLPSYKITCL